jgi:hypothetical protein
MKTVHISPTQLAAISSETPERTSPVTITKLAAEVEAALKILNPERKAFGGQPVQVQPAANRGPEAANSRDPASKALGRQNDD